MILAYDRNPKFSLIYIGSIILEKLKERKDIDIEELFSYIKEKIDKSISVNYLFYALDLLYLLSMVYIEGEKVFYDNREIDSKENNSMS